MSIERDVETINASLAMVREHLINASKNFDETALRSGELSARLQNVEQVVADLDSRRGTISGGPVGGVGSEVLTTLQDDGAFMQASATAMREGKLGLFASRANLNTGIRAALTHGRGYGSTTELGFPSDPERGRIIGPAFRPLRLLDALPVRQTDRDSVEFVQLTSTGDASEQVREGDEKAELDLYGDPVRAEIVTIAAWTAASRQVLSDHAALQSQIDRLLRGKVRDRLEHQIVQGDGSAGHISGLLEQASQFNESAATAADVIGEALVHLADSGYSPDLIVLNPLDWFTIQTQKTAVEGRYMFGSPTTPTPPALWNTAIVTTSSLPHGEALVLDTRFVTVLDRQQLSVEVSNSHDKFFIKNLVAILCELRAGLEVADQGAVLNFDLLPYISSTDNA